LSDEDEFEPIGREETNIDSSDDEAPPAPSQTFQPAKISLPKYNAKQNIQRHEQDKHKQDFPRYVE